MTTRPARRTRAVALFVLGLASLAASPSAADDDLAEMSLEDLMNVEITSVSKKSEKLSRSPAAVYVLTNEDIRRSGATNIPEALRMVPGIQVAQITANRWAISARGFNEEFATKLLVLIDGRSVYTPLFSGVFWDVQDVMLEDIDRIEVIRGPGAALWGANAVNGVINIITRRAEDTQGALATAGGGTEERGFGALRWGGAIGDAAHYRVYGKYFDRDAFDTEDGHDAGDGWDMARGGFRVDWTPTGDDDVTFQGDYYEGDVGERHFLFDSFAPLVRPLVQQDVDVEGWNLLGRWTRRFSETSELSVQTYFDRTVRQIDYVDERRNTADLDVQHRFAPAAGHDLVWGFGYRWTRDWIDDSPTLRIDGDSQTDQLLSAFFQDEITLVDDRLWLTLGSKFEYNDYTGFEYQPNGRLLFTPHEQHTLWASVARAVRTPNRVEQDVSLPYEAFEDVLAETFDVSVPTGLPSPFPPSVTVNVPVRIPYTTLATIMGNHDFRSERVMAYELGYRFTPDPRFSLDVAAFWNDYDDLRSIEPLTPDSSALEAIVPRVVAATLMGGRIPRLDEPGVSVPIRFGNDLEAESYGVEVAGQLDVTSWWRIRTSYTWLEVNASRTRPMVDEGTEAGLENGNPTHQFHVRSYVDLPYDFELDSALYYVENIYGSDVPSNVRVDLRLGWQPREGLRLSLVGQNLFDERRPEFQDGIFGPRSLVERSFYGKVEWQF